MDYIKLLRVKHYIKNLLVFFPLIFGGFLFNITIIMKVSMGFLAFCCMSSVIYIVNDIKDVEKDRQHEKKKYRPIASGKVSIKKAYIIAIILFIVSIIINILSFKENVVSIVILLTYFAINMVYSVFNGKRIPILDIVLLVSGFVLRLYYGAVISDIEVSEWLTLVIISGSSYLAFGKRRNELIKNQDTTREVLQFYSQNFLDKSMYSCMTLAIVFYSLWCMDKNQRGTSNFLITVPILMIILFKYSMDIECVSKIDGDPVDVIISDKVLIILVFILAVVLGFLIYF